MSSIVGDLMLKMALYNYRLRLLPINFSRSLRSLDGKCQCLQVVQILLLACDVINKSTFDRPHSLSNIALQRDQIQWPSSTCKEQKTAISPSTTHVKQEPSDQSNDQQKPSCLPHTDHLLCLLHLVNWAVLLQGI